LPSAVAANARFSSGELGQAGRGVAAATDFASSLANMPSGRTALALIVASFGVTMSPNLSLTQSAYCACVRSFWRRSVRAVVNLVVAIHTVVVAAADIERGLLNCNAPFANANISKMNEEVLNVHHPSASDKIRRVAAATTKRCRNTSAAESAGE
jgi:hypothetical protein